MCYDSSIAEKMQVVYIDHSWYEDDRFLRYFGVDEDSDYPIGAFAMGEDGLLKDGWYAYVYAEDWNDVLHYIPDRLLECGDAGKCWLWRLDDCQQEA